MRDRKSVDAPAREGKKGLALGQILSTGWTIEQSDALERFIGAGLSYAGAAAEINREYGTVFSRNAAIGRANRIGLAAPQKPRRGRTPRVYKYKPRPERQKYSSVAKRFYPALDGIEIEYLRCAEVEPQHVRLIDLATDGCRYPFGDSPFTFCNHRQHSGSSYCSKHFVLSRRGT